MTTERDITGYVRFLVEAWQRHDALTRELQRTASRTQSVESTEEREKMRVEREKIELGIKQAAIDLAVGVLVDLHRCADALEDIAESAAKISNTRSIP